MKTREAERRADDRSAGDRRVADAGTSQALDLIHKGLDMLFEEGFPTDGTEDAQRLIAEVEKAGRRVGSARTAIEGGAPTRSSRQNPGEGWADLLLTTGQPDCHAEAGYTWCRRPRPHCGQRPRSWTAHDSIRAPATPEFMASTR